MESHRRKGLTVKKLENSEGAVYYGYTSNNEERITFSRGTQKYGIEGASRISINGNVHDYKRSLNQKCIIGAIYFLYVPFCSFRERY